MLTIGVFGPLRVDTGTRTLGASDCQGNKPKQLLEILAIARGHGVSKEALADHLWGDSPPAKWLATLETYVSVLRRTIQPGVRAQDSLVVTERGGYRLSSEGVELDLTRFDELLRASSAAAPPQALQALDAALRLVRGVVLEDEPFSEWAVELRTAYLPRQVTALVSAGQLNLLGGDATSALVRAEQAIALNPLSEAAYQVQMLACYALWRQDEALAAYDRCRRLLGEELGVDPLDSTVALYLAILRHEDVASLLPRAAAEPATDIAPVARKREQTPDHAGVLLSRDQELAQIRGVIDGARGGRFSVVLVTGDTGMGKTSLVDAATSLADLPMGSNRCSDLEQELPYLALAMALRSIPGSPDGGAGGLPMLDGLLARSEPVFDAFARMRVMEALATWLGQQKQPLLLLLDDVQWADEETLRTLGYLHRRCAAAPVVVLLTCDRPALSRPALRALNVDLRIDLDVLPASAVDDDELYALTGGHPMFLAGWAAARARGLTEDFPPELCERVLMGCWDLGPQAFQLLNVCCALEFPATPRLLGSLVGIPVASVAEELDRLVYVGALIAADDAFTFRSPAVRAILRETLSPARRGVLQEQATAWLSFPRRRVVDGVAEPLLAPPQRRGSDRGVQSAELVLAVR